MSTQVPPQIKLLHISDTHFGAHCEHKKEALISFVDEWNPDVIAVTGDIVDFPLPRFFGIAADFLSRLRARAKKVYCIPGNHDAYLGRLGLRTFWPRLNNDIQNKTTFVDCTQIHGQTFCVIGVDTTHFSILQAAGAGIFTEWGKKKLEAELQRLARSKDLSAAIKVILVHHHPLPTRTSHRERMLYFKNSGLFLNFAVDNNIRLILHGHQHDPHFTKVGFGTGFDEDSIAVFSAGSCMKHSENRGCGQFYALTIELERTYVKSYYYDTSNREFNISDDFSISSTASKDPRLLTFEQQHALTATGDLKSKEIRTYQRTTDGACTVAINIGVDPQSDSCTDFNELDLKVAIDGSPGRVAIELNEPHSKRLVIDAGAGQKDMPFTVSVQYNWPGGFRPFLSKRSDSGEITLRSKGVEWYKVQIKIEDSRWMLKRLQGRYDGTKLEPNELSAQQGTLVVSRPAASKLVRWDAEIDIAPAKT